MSTHKRIRWQVNKELQQQLISSKTCRRRQTMMMYLMRRRRLLANTIQHSMLICPFQMKLKNLSQTHSVGLVIELDQYQELQQVNHQHIFMVEMFQVFFKMMLKQLHMHLRMVLHQVVLNTKILMVMVLSTIMIELKQVILTQTFYLV